MASSTHDASAATDAYRRTLADLYALEAERGIDLKLDRVQRALALLGSPEQRFPVILIAGTNGKGSTAAIVEAAYRQAGYRVGLYTSPHLIDFTERIRVDGRTIAKADVVERTAALRRTLDRAGIALTFFELVSVLAFDAFARAAVEIAVLEVGLGGRLDATSVATPIVTAVTTIGYDHQEYLGDTLTAIAREKAGVMRPGVPVVIGPVPPPAARILLSHARTVGSSVAQYGRDYRVCGCDAVRFDVVTGSRHWSDLTLKLRGTFQRTNAATALMLLELARASHPVPSEAVRRALDDVFWPGRLDVVLETPQVILDGAHNPEAARALARELAPVAADRCVRLVFGAMRDKNWLDMWEALRPLVHEVILTQPSLPRSRSPETLARVIREDGIPVRVVPGPQEAVAAALASSSCDDLIVVTGSLFLVGDVYPFFLRQQGRRHLFEPWHDEAADGTEARG